MTAPHDSDSGSDNSDSRTIDEPHTTTRRECLPLAVAVRESGGWSTRNRLALDFGMPMREIDDCLDALASDGDLDTFDLGDVTLVVAPTQDVDDAIAELFDEHEQRWRAEKGWEMPDSEDFDG